jgi:putative lipoic acid-binding regulatory protein
MNLFATSLPTRQAFCYRQYNTPQPHNAPQGDSTPMMQLDGEYSEERFKALLEEQYVWPTEFVFKFIVPAAQVEELTQILNTDHIEVRPSRGMKFVSITAKIKVSSSDEVVFVYNKVQTIKGIIAL